VHQSALDRMKLPVCDYRPGNLAAYLAGAVKPATCNTKRIARGEPCQGAA
jgi:hypothetical protein